MTAVILDFRPAAAPDDASTNDRAGLLRLLGLDALPAHRRRLVCRWQADHQGRLFCRWEIERSFPSCVATVTKVR